MRPAPLTIQRPNDLADALDLLAEDEDTKPLAGGQSLVPMLNFRLARPETLVDIRHLHELTDVHVTDDGVRIGALTTHADLEDGVVPGPPGALLSSMARQLAYRPVRNRGTVGGSLAHADTRAEWPLAFAALDAEVRLISRAGTRTVSAANLPQGPFTADVESGELIESIIVPANAASTFGYCKIAAKAGEYADAMAVAEWCEGADTANCWIGAPSSQSALVELPILGSRFDEWLADARKAVAAAVPTLRNGHDLQLAAVAAGRALEDAMRRADDRADESDTSGEHHD